MEIEKVRGQASEFQTRRKIEFSDTDMAGIVHFSRFFIFMETAEHEFLRSLGTSVDTEDQGHKIGWPRLSASCDYLKPIKFEDEIGIHLTIIRKGTKSLTYHFEFTHHNEVVARGRLGVICCICNPGQPIKSIPIPAFIADQIRAVPTEL